MFKRKVLYSDVPAPYDADARRNAGCVGLFILGMFLLAIILILVF